jgi:hypothetical protein
MPSIPGRVASQANLVDDLKIKPCLRFLDIVDRARLHIRPGKRGIDPDAALLVATQPRHPGQIPRLQRSEILDQNIRYRIFQHPGFHKYFEAMLQTVVVS